MNVKCKNCSGETPIGSIFCHLCGAKLIFHEIDSKIRRNIKRSKAKKIYGVIYRIMFMIIIICALVAVYLVLDPFNSSICSKKQISNDLEERAISVMNSIEIGKRGIYTISSLQLNFLALKYLGTKAKPAYCGIIDGNYFKFTFSETVLDYYIRVHIIITAVFKPVMLRNKDGTESLGFDLCYIKFGNFPLPSGISQIFIDIFKPYSTNSRINKIRKKIDRINIAGDNAELIIR